MRISSHQYHLNTLRTIQQSSSEYNQWTQKLASNKRILKPSDDPLGASMLMTLDSQLATLEQYGDNMDAVHFNLGQQESQLTSIVDMMYTVQDKVTKSADGTVGEAEMTAYGQELEILMQGIVDLMNSQDGSGRFSFSGSLTDTQPFQLDASGHYQYMGDSLTRKVLVSPSSNVISNIVGSDLDPGAAFLNQMNDFVTLLKTAPAGGVGTEARTLLPMINDFQGQLTSGITQIGGIRASLDQMELANGEISLFTEGLKDDISVVDYAEGTVKMTEALASYKSSLEVYASVGDLSLFNYL